MIEHKYFLVPGCSCILFTLSVTKLSVHRRQFQFSIKSSQSSSLNHDSEGKTSSLSATLKITETFNNYLLEVEQNIVICPWRENRLRQIIDLRDTGKLQ